VERPWWHEDRVAGRECAGARDGFIAFVGERQFTVEHAKPLCEGVPVVRWAATGPRGNLDHVKRRRCRCVKQQRDMVAARDGIGSSVAARVGASGRCASVLVRISSVTDLAAAPRRGSDDLRRGKESAWGGVLAECPGDPGLT
jgi:hypothetical protein